MATPRFQTRPAVNVTANIFITVLLSALVTVYYKLGTAHPRGFSCDDSTIRLPYHEETISSTMLIVLSCSPLIVMLIWEAALQLLNTQEIDPKWQRVLRAIYNVILSFVFGFTLTFIVTQITKYSLGVLRPHFIDACKPDWTRINCTDGYIADYTCLNTDLARIEHARQSFPSGHASLSWFGLIYFSVFLKYRLPETGIYLLKPSLIFSVLLLALYVCLTRIFDNWHHPIDVICGAILGTIMALIASLHVGKLKDTSTSSEFKQQNNHDKMDMRTDTNVIQPV